jgi:chromosome segregation ATPase
MENRSKFGTLIFRVTLTMATLVVLQSIANQDAVLRSPSFVLNHPIEALTVIGDELLNFGNSPSLWYGGIALIALVMLRLTLKATRGGELRDLKKQLTELEAAKEEAQTSLQQGLRHAQRERDSAVKDMEEGLRSIYTLQNQLYEKEKVLKGRAGELAALRTQVSALTRQVNQKAVSKKPADSEWRKELTKKTSLLQAKENVIRELEDHLSNQAHAFENQLNERDELLQSRDKELQTLRQQLTQNGTTKKQAETLLQQELKKVMQALEAKEATIKELEKNSSSKVHVLETQLSERDKLLKSREEELGSLGSEVSALKERLTELRSAKERAKSLLQGEFKKKIELLEAKEATIKELEERLSTSVHALERQDRLLKGRDKELESLR